MNEYESFTMTSLRSQAAGQAARILSSGASNVRGTGVRCWSDSMLGFACADDVGPDTAASLRERSLAAARVRVESCPFPPWNQDISVSWPQDPRPADLGVVEAWVLEAEDHARAGGATTTELSHAVSVGTTTHVQNTLGLKASGYTLLHQVSVMAVCERSGRTGSGAAHMAWRHAVDVRPDRVAARASSLAVAGSYAPTPHRPSDPVLLTPAALKGFTRWLADRCRLSGPVYDVQLLDGDISLIEDRTDPTCLMACAHDGEGLTTGPHWLVEHGRRSGYAGTYAESSITGRIPSATATRAYNTQPVGRCAMPRLVVPDEGVLRGGLDCTVIVGWSGTSGAFDSRRSTLSVGAIAYVVRRGEVVAPVRQCMATGDFKRLLSQASSVPGSSLSMLVDASECLVRLDLQLTGANK
jgi:predicted Zn-dependent protease